MQDMIRMTLYKAARVALDVSFLTEKWEKELYAASIYSAAKWAEGLEKQSKQLKEEKNVHTD